VPERIIKWAAAAAIVGGLILLSIAALA